VETPAMITGHRGNGAPGPDLTGLENQPTAARSGVAAITAGQTLIRTFGCNSCEADNGPVSAIPNFVGPIVFEALLYLGIGLYHLIRALAVSIYRSLGGCLNWR
jgi:hypothetical protein